MSKISKARWEKMSEIEKTDLIEKMQAGAHKQRIIMIDAWNNSPDVREKLVKFLTKNNKFIELLVLILSITSYLLFENIHKPPKNLI